MTGRGVGAVAAGLWILAAGCDDGGRTAGVDGSTRRVGGDDARPPWGADADTPDVPYFDLGAPPPPDAGPDAAPDAALCGPAGARLCVAGRPREVDVCGADGRWRRTACDPGLVCVEGRCERPGRDCVAGQRGCVDDRTPGLCEPGEGFAPRAPCPDDQRCFRGECLSPACAAAAAQNSYLGCDYWPVDLPSIRYLGPGEAHPDAPLGVIVVNPDPERPAHVTAYGPDGAVGALVPEYHMTPPVGDPDIPVALYPEVRLRSQVHAADHTVLRDGLERVEGLEVPPGGLLRLLLPRSAPEDRASGVARTAWRIRSDRPLAAYQYSPLCCNYSFSNDASLLLPASSLGSRYRFLGVPSQGGVPAALTVVGTVDDTEVRVRFPATAVVQGDPTGRFRVETGEAILRLDAHEVLTVRAGFGPLSAVQRDLTGAVVEATSPVSVFSSHPCARWPDGVPACDHLEEQLFPSGTWGRHFVLAPPADRGQPPPETEATWWRLLADEQPVHVDLHVEYEVLAARPPGNEGTPDCRDHLIDERILRLEAGAACEFGSRRPLFLSADGPLLVMGILGGQGTTGIESPYGARAGDPSMFLVPPVRQFREVYDFLTPETYARSFVTIVATPTVRLRLDGRPYPLVDTRPVIGDRFIYAHVPLARGAHHLEGSEPFGILVYAYDDFVSYAFTGGLNLSKE